MLTVTQNSQIFTITLNRPELHNAFDDHLIEQLIDTLNKVNRDDSTRVVILAANGKSFCAGADLNWMRRMAKYSHEENLQDAGKLASLIHTLNTLNKPTIALIQGAAYGGGVGLVACCDIAIATSNASFCFSEVKLGLVPAVISPYAIAAIGERAARRYFLTAEVFTAEEALQLGLIHSVVEPDQLLSAGNKIAEQLLKNSPQAISASKKLISQVANHAITDELINKTIQCIADIRVSNEGQEGLNSFLEKRNPSWVK